MKKKQLFSFRKLSVGIASVSLGTLVFLSGVQNANAEDTSVANASNTQKNADKDAKALNSQMELAKKAGAEQEIKEKTANVKKQVEVAKNVANEQAELLKLKLNLLKKLELNKLKKLKQK